MLEGMLRHIWSYRHNWSYGTICPTKRHNWSYTAQFVLQNGTIGPTWPNLSYKTAQLVLHGTICPTKWHNMSYINMFVYAKNIFKQIEINICINVCINHQSTWWGGGRGGPRGLWYSNFLILDIQYYLKI